MFLGIEKFIELTTMNAYLDLELMSVVLRFWSKSVNSFLFPFGLVSFILRDVSILIGLPI